MLFDAHLRPAGLAPRDVADFAHEIRQLADGEADAVAVVGPDPADLPVVDVRRFENELLAHMRTRHAGVLSGVRTNPKADVPAELGDIVDRVEVLPYHRLGVDKYAALGRSYPLLGTPTPTRESVEQALAKPSQRIAAAVAGHRADMPNYAEAGSPGTPMGLVEIQPDQGPQPEQRFSLDRPLREARDAFERMYFEHLIQTEGGSMTRVADKSGLERTHLYRKLRSLGIEIAATADD